MSSLTAEANRTIREGIFRTTENHSTPASQPPAVENVLIRKIQVYTLGADWRNDEVAVKAFHLYLMVCGTSLSDERHEWQNYVATIASACFAPMKAGILEDPGYEEIILSEPIMTALKEWFEIYSGAIASTVPDDKTQMLLLAQNEMPNLQLPSGSVHIDVNLRDTLDAPGVYGHFSMILFLAGKNITDKNRIAITMKRPGAIEGKYYAKRRVACLSGPLALSQMAHSQVHAAFVTMVHLRRVVFLHVSVLTASPVGTAAEIVSTTTRLMRFAGMQQAVIIDEYLSSHDEAFEIPFLMPSIQAYTASMRNLQAAPAEQRPFYKMIHGDITRAFNRNDILSILCVALVTARETNPTLVNYEIPSNFQLVMDKYHASLQQLANEN